MNLLNKKHIRKYGILFIIALCFCCSCQAPFQMENSKDKESSDTGFIKSDIGYYDSADTAVVMEKNEEKSTISLLNREVGKTYTLEYDGATEISDKHKEAMSMSQILPGEIVDVTFVKQSKRLNSIQVSELSWAYDNVEKYSFGRNNKTMTIGEEEFGLYENVPVISNGTKGELIDLNASDILTVRGIDHTIYSITVDKGHGYLRLSNDQYFIGGWIEVGQKVIQPITEGMLLVVPEGSYQVLLTNTRIEGKKEITIDRDGEVELDVGDIQPEELKYGSIIFSIIPSDATLYIDGDLQDYSKPVSLEYGIHQMIVKAEGYQSVTQYIKVGQEKATINVELEKKTESSSDKNNNSVSANTGIVEGNTISSNNTVFPTATTSTANKVYIDSPEGAELYLDSNYIGVIPVAFSKSSGTHIVTLRKNGCQTKSYTLQIDTEAKDITYSFADLIASVGAAKSE